MGFPGKGKGYLTGILLVFLLGLLLIAAGRGGLSLPRKIVSQKAFFMDTMVEIKVTGREREVRPALEKAFSVMESWADELDRFQGESLISRINAAGSSWVEVSPGLSELLAAGLKFARITGGAFDPTIAPLVDLWGFGSETQQVPSRVGIEGVLGRIDYRRLRLDPGRRRVFLPEGMAVDPGGMAKGFIIDRGLEILQAAGIEGIYLNAGGNIRVMGNKARGEPWRLGISKPRGEGVYQQYVLALDRGSLATSGDYERFFIEEGVRYSHLLDPRTGYPAREMQAATVYAPTALEADILSTAVFVLGWEEGRELIEILPGIEALLVREGEIWLSSGFSSLLDPGRQQAS